MKPRRRHREGMEWEGEDGAVFLSRGGRAGRAQVTRERPGAKAGWVNLNEGPSQRAERLVVQPRNSQRSWRKRAMWPRVQAALDGGA